MNEIAYRAARENVALFDLSDRTKIELGGRDRAAFLHNFCTNDIVKLPLWHGCEAFLTTAQAKIVASFAAFQLPEAIWLDAEPGLGEQIVNYLERFHISEDVTLTDRSNDFAELLVVGPKAADVLGTTLDASITELADMQMSSWFSAHEKDSQLRRLDVLGEPCFALTAPSSRLSEWKDILIKTGAVLGERSAYETLRIEAGMPEYGRDIDETNLPQEVNRTERAISFTKGCYVGQETVARIRAYGHVNRLLVGLKLDGVEPASANAKLWHQNQEVGRVTSSVYSPRMQTAIALGYVRRAQAVAGASLELETPAGRRGAKVMDKELLRFAARRSQASDAV